MEPFLPLSDEKNNDSGECSVSNFWAFCQRNSYLEHASFHGLEAWKNGLRLVQDIYQLTRKLPREELFGITAQLRRASCSILANLAEGSSRYTYADKVRSFVIARGESSEVEAFLIICISLDFLGEEETKHALEQTQQERRLLSGLISSLRNRSL